MHWNNLDQTSGVCFGYIPKNLNLRQTILGILLHTAQVADCRQIWVDA